MRRTKCICKHIFTGKDNETYDMGRILWAVGVVIFFGLAIYDVINSNKFDALSYGTGLGGLLTGGGAGIALKSKTEPE